VQRKAPEPDETARPTVARPQIAPVGLFHGWGPRL
jgi:hypothetical protein